MVIAAKFHDDKFYSNNYYSRLGGVTLKEMNLLERQFLTEIKYDLFVPTHTYKKYKVNIT